MTTYVQVAEDEQEEAIEIPCEDDGTLLLSTVTAQFPGASGLKFKNPESRSYRAVRLVEGKFHAPEDGWTRTFVCVFPKEEMTPDDLREYFSKFGEVTDVFIPKPFRAFAFVTFMDPEIAHSLCGEDHIIKGVSVHVSSAAPKNDPNRGPWGRGPGRVDMSSPRGGPGTGPPGTGSGWVSHQPRGGELPNLQALGSSLGLSGGPGGQSGSHQQGNPGQMGSPQGMNLNLGGIPAAIAAAVMNQAGWGILSNLGSGQHGGPQGGGPPPPPGSGDQYGPPHYQTGMSGAYGSGPANAGYHSAQHGGGWGYMSQGNGQDGSRGPHGAQGPTSHHQGSWPHQSSDMKGQYRTSTGYEHQQHM
ncbi:unnamed protein product [Cyprideis torosa]|uniref:Uncharacterized protein n=1 Tax=Cyprideis torosa TaxID=163714 RepID=A0A7R8ZQL6_9CRUS|nr:unnamed protein product [Cyprideis torosa]CAG0896711.1 unnamed protein product [Cyprideis torosa]